MTKAGKAEEQTAYLFNEHTWSCTAEGEPGKDNGPNEAGGYFPAWARNGQKFVQWKYLKFKQIGIKSMVSRWNSKTQFVTKLLKKTSCDITLKLKMWCNKKQKL